MGAARDHDSVRRMRFSSWLDRHERGEITQDEAAAYLGMSVPSFQRWNERTRSARPLRPPGSAAGGRDAANLGRPHLSPPARASAHVTGAAPDHAI